MVYMNLVRKRNSITNLIYQSMLWNTNALVYNPVFNFM